jgi:L-threonylcarbamoyladenylate synthase
VLDVLDQIWPAPLTAILPIVSIEGRPLPAAAGLPELAVRVPAHAGLRTLLSELGGGLTATSANPSGGAPATTPEAAAALLAGEDGALVDGGTLPGGPPSTIVRWTPGGLEVVRAGSFPVDRLKKPGLPDVVGTYVGDGMAGHPSVPRKTEEEP